MLGVGVIFPYIENSENYVWYFCQTMRYVSEKRVYRAVFYHVFGLQMKYLLVKDEHRNGPLRNGGNFRPIFFIKNYIL